MAINKSLTLKL